MLKEAVDDLRISDGRKQSLYPCCEIPWDKDNMSFNAFYQLFPAIINVLSRLSLDNDETIETIVSARKAGNYLDTILKEQFIKVLLLLKESFKTLTDISGEFQKIDLRIIPAMERIQNLTSRIDEWLIGEGSCTIANIEADYQELKELVLDYYIRKAPYNFNFEQKVFRPFLIDFRQQLRNYFGQHFHLMAQFVFLLPGKMAEFREISDLVKFYIDNNLISAGTDDVRHEFFQWHKYAIDKLYFPLTELIPKAQKMNFKTIATLLQAYVTIPASDGERTCSSLKDIKDCLQNSTFDSHFNALFSIYSNDNIQCTEDEVITMFKARRVHFAA
uniref:Uncharacterized protein n=1 Tax=Panagrolaimus sp. ES5 TaxID=591445 RepID=A0AC34GXW7_9BILA